MDPIYLDYNATTPIDPAVAEAMRPFLSTEFGNPSSPHRYGIRAREAVERAREQVAGAIGAARDEIVFTSGGTESNNLAIRGAALAHGGRGDHIVTSAVEHPAVSEVCGQLEREGFRVTSLPVDGEGLLDLCALETAVTAAPVLVTVMHANNEVGTVQPIAEIASLARRRGALVHTDAAQSMGKIPVDVEELGVDLLSIAGHKLYGPKGVGALYVRSGARIEKLMHGAGHERGLRPGTENIMEIAGLGAACALASRELAERSLHLRRLRDRLHEGLAARFPGLLLNGHAEKRLPNTLSVSFPGVEADALLAEVEDVAASAGAACHATGVVLSATLEAMGVSAARAKGTVRFSTGKLLTEAEVDRAVASIAAAVDRLRKR